MKLSDLKTGDTGVVLKVGGHGNFRKRLIEMGFIPGKKVSAVMNAPLKDPIEYEIPSAGLKPPSSTSLLRKIITPRKPELSVSL